MSSDATLPIQPGALVCGRFAVDEVLGVGGMGAVYSARDVATEARVAIKCMLPELATNAEVVTRFVREARATLRLRSEHVARVFDSGALPSGVPFIVMEHLEGCDLKSLVRASGPLSAEDAADYVAQACTALAEAHALGIVHRDLKPANLFLTRRPEGGALVKVLDFGIAKFSSPSLVDEAVMADMTQTSGLLGSRAYMPPEQMLRPKDVDARADVWSLGVILYFLVTGKSPFAAETVEGMILKIVHGDPEPLSLHRADLPPGFAEIVSVCLAKARENRFSNVTELARALAPFARREIDSPTLTLDRRPFEGSAHSLQSVAISVLAPPEEPTLVMSAAAVAGRRRSKGIAFAGVAGVAVLVAAGAAFVSPSARVASRAAPVGALFSVAGAGAPRPSAPDVTFASAPAAPAPPRVTPASLAPAPSGSSKASDASGKLGEVASKARKVSAAPADAPALAPPPASASARATAPAPRTAESAAARAPRGKPAALPPDTPW